MNAFGGTSTKRRARDSPTTRGSSHAFACRIRCCAACQRSSAPLIAGLFSSTARVTSPNESFDEAAPYSPLSAAIRFRIDKDLANKIKKVVVFIDPGLRLKTKRAHNGHTPGVSVFGSDE